ncbi:plasminogen-like [Lineus longissimus]|uniref:plasminogen-like n=1 Tax=Lineus longissimus TaxID=88925 RepID=UPI00315CB1D5
MKNLLQQLIVLLIFAYLPTSYSSTTCLPTVWGVYYTGTVSKTRGGLPCQRWDAHAPHKHSYGKDAFFPYDGGIKGANNFCRNPRGKMKKDCKPDTVGKTYKGTVRVTKSGRPCQYWSAQYPHRYRYIKYALFPEKKLRLAKNYCRNPTGKPAPPKVSGKSDQNPSMCLPTEYGVYYTGGVSKTRSGLTCQRWDAQAPHKHSYNKKKYFPDGDYKKAANFCRNPGGKKTGVWCYTTDKKKTWDYCKVTLCTPQKKDCKVDTRGKVYVGTVSVTKSGKPCQHWASQFPHAHPYAKKAELFPDVNLGLAKNYCRNPTNDPHGPWCITATASTVKEYCDIPICPQGEIEYFIDFNYWEFYEFEIGKTYDRNIAKNDQCP